MAAVRERAGGRRGGARSPSSGRRAERDRGRRRRGRGGGARAGRRVGAERAGGARDSSREETVSEARAARGRSRGAPGAALSPFSGRGRLARAAGISGRRKGQRGAVVRSRSSLRPRRGLGAGPAAPAAGGPGRGPARERGWEEGPSCSRVRGRDPLRAPELPPLPHPRWKVWGGLGPRPMLWDRISPPWPPARSAREAGCPGEPAPELSRPCPRWTARPSAAVRGGRG